MILFFFGKMLFSSADFTLFPDLHSKQEAKVGLAEKKFLLLVQMQKLFFRALQNIWEMNKFPFLKM